MSGWLYQAGSAASQLLSGTVATPGVAALTITTLAPSIDVSGATVVTPGVASITITAYQLVGYWDSRKSSMFLAM